MVETMIPQSCRYKDLICWRLLIRCNAPINLNIPISSMSQRRIKVWAGNNEQWVVFNKAVIVQSWDDRFGLRCVLCLFIIRIHWIEHYVPEAEVRDQQMVQWKLFLLNYSRVCAQWLSDLLVNSMLEANKSILSVFLKGFA